MLRRFIHRPMAYPLLSLCLALLLASCSHLSPPPQAAPQLASLASSPTTVWLSYPIGNNGFTCNNYIWASKFTVPIAETWTVNTFSFYFFINGTSTSGPVYTLKVYADNGGKPGNTLHTFSNLVGTPPSSTTNDRAAFVVPAFDLPAGSYWLSTQDMNPCAFAMVEAKWGEAPNAFEFKNNAWTEVPNYAVAYGLAHDTLAPKITVATPQNAAVFSVGQSVKAAFSCTDETMGSAVKNCTGNVANGAALNTNTAGSYSFTVDALDNAGNSSTLTYNYQVVSAQPASYRVLTNYANFNIVNQVALNKGMKSATGSNTSPIYVRAKKASGDAQFTKTQNEMLFLAAQKTATSPNTAGGLMIFDFKDFGPVAPKSLRLSSVTGIGSKVLLFKSGAKVKDVSIAKQSTSQTLDISGAAADWIQVKLTGSGFVDDLTFTQLP